MTLHSSISGVAKAKTGKRRSGKATRYLRSTVPPSDLFENGKRITGGDTIFERPVAVDRQVISDIRSLEIKQVTPTQALKLLRKMHHVLVDGKRS